MVCGAGSAVCCPAAKAAPAPASKCPGTCQAATSKCGVAFQHGLCPGANLCCPSSHGTPAAPVAPVAPAPSSAGLTGVSSYIRDPETLVKNGRTIQWSDLTVAQQSNTRLLMLYAQKNGITDGNQKAYILGTASVTQSFSRQVCTRGCNDSSICSSRLALMFCLCLC